MKLFVSSISGEVELRTETFGGREYLVAPAIPIVEGVMNGELTSADEISRYVDAWNGRPVTIDHNYDENNTPLTANNPDFLESNGVGWLFNAEFREKKLHAELWIDVEKAEGLGGEALTALEKLRNHEQLEVSTGYFRDKEKKAGIFNGRRYRAIQYNLRPDHLALLPNDTGACSWKDGCGAPRVNKEEEVASGVNENAKKWFASLAEALGFKVNEGLGDSDRRQMLESVLKDGLGEDEWAWIEDVYSDEADSYIIYEKGGSHFKQEYDIDDDLSASLVGDPVEVVLVKQWKVKGGEEGDDNGDDEGQASNKNTGEGIEVDKALTKEEIIASLVANKCAELTEEELTALDEGVLQKMQVALAACQDEGEKTGDSSKEPAINKSPGDRGDKDKKSDGEEDDIRAFMQAVNDLGGIETIRELADNAKSEKERLETEKGQLVTELAANGNCAFEEEDLKAMTVNQLAKLKRSLSPGNYAGVGGPSVYGVGDDEAIPEPPRILTAKKKGEEKAS